MKRLLLPIILLLGLGACDMASQAVMLGANLVSYVHTDKTLTDHAISFISEEDCSIRHSANNEPYCQPLENDLAGPVDDRPAPPELASREAVYCYRTLGDISCYREPDTAASDYAAMQ